jgi:hypothetical protein
MTTALPRYSNTAQPSLFSTVSDHSRIVQPPQFHYNPLPLFQRVLKDRTGATSRFYISGPNDSCRSDRRERLLTSGALAESVSPRAGRISKGHRRPIRSVSIPRRGPRGCRRPAARLPAAAQRDGMGPPLRAAKWCSTARARAGAVGASAAGLFQSPVSARRRSTRASNRALPTAASRSILTAVLSTDPGVFCDC